MKEKQKKDVGAVMTMVVSTAIKFNLFDAKTTKIIFSGEKKTFEVLRLLKN